MSGDFLTFLLLGAIIGIILYQLVLKPIRNRRRVAAAEAARRQRIMAYARHTAEDERLQRQQENPSVVFGRLVPHKTEDEITRKLREKTPLRPILRSNEAAKSRVRSESGSTLHTGQPFMDDDLNHLLFASQYDDACIDGRYSPRTDTDRGTSHDATRTSNHTTTDDGWSGSGNDSSGGATTDSSPASTGDSGSSSSGD